MTIQELLRDRKEERKPEVLLSKLAGVNLCDLWLTVNRYELRVKKDEKTFFEITAPTLIYACFSKAEWQAVEKLLCEKQRHFGVYHLPPFYYKGQGNHWLFDLELDCGHDKPQLITLTDFGYNLGQISVNGIAVDISHSGGTHNGTWVDFTHGFRLVGENKLKVLKSLIG